LRSFSYLDRSRDRSTPVKKNAQIFLVVVGVVILFSSAQSVADHALLTVNKLRRRPAAQMAVAKSHFSQMRRSSLDLCPPEVNDANSRINSISIPSLFPLRPLSFLFRSFSLLSPFHFTSLFFYPNPVRRSGSAVSPQAGSGVESRL